MNYVAGRYLHGRGAFVLADNTGEIRISIGLPAKRFVNLRTNVDIVDGKPQISSASLGSLPLPAPLSNLPLQKS